MSPTESEPKKKTKGFNIPRPDSVFPSVPRTPKQQVRVGAKSLYAPDPPEAAPSPTTERMLLPSAPVGNGFEPVAPPRSGHSTVPPLPSGLGAAGSGGGGNPNAGARTTPIVGRMDVSVPRPASDSPAHPGWTQPGLPGAHASPRMDLASTMPVFPSQTFRGFYGDNPGQASSSVPPAASSSYPPRPTMPPARTGVTRQGMPAVTPPPPATTRPGELPRIESYPVPSFNPAATIVGMPAVNPGPRNMPAANQTVMGMSIPPPPSNAGPSNIAAPTDPGAPTNPTTQRVVVRPTLSLGSPGPGGVGPLSLDALLQASVAESGHSSKSSGSWRLNLHNEKSTPVPLVRRSSPDMAPYMGMAHTSLGLGSAENVAPGQFSPQNYGAFASGNPSGFAASNGAPSMIAINQFQVVERLAQGGTGSVYLATRNASEQYALKVLRRENLGSEESEASLRREAQLLSELTHPNVVRLFDVGSEGGEPFLVMEFIDGLSLSELLSYPLRAPLSVGITIVRDALRALSYIHELERGPNPRGIIHGDVSPQNLLVGSDGRARLIDFGVAREPGLPARDSVVRCKPRYASPELLAGDPLGAESDLFAVGAVLFHVLTGRKLFTATEQAELLTQVTTAHIPPPSSANPEAPKAFDELCLRALQRDRTRRFQSAAEMLQALEFAASAAGLTLSEQAVADWVRRVRRSLIQDVELGADEVASLLATRGAANRNSGDRISLVPDTDRAPGPKLDATLYVRIAVVVALVLVAIAVVVFAIAAPDRFVQFFSGGK